VYFTVLGEAPLKMLRYQQQFAFFDADKVNRAVYFVSLSQQVADRNLTDVLDIVMHEVKARSPSLVMVDSFRTLARAARGTDAAEAELQIFLHKLALNLANWQATTFLLGEYPPIEGSTNPIFTAADGILSLQQSAEGNAAGRTIQVIKMRGQEALPGLHPLRISREGIRVFPRTSARLSNTSRPGTARLAFGLHELDAMLRDGIPEGDAMLVIGPAGSGKSLLASHFVVEGATRHQPAVVALFDERPSAFVARAEGLGLRLERLVRADLVHPLDLRSLELTVDYVLMEILSVVDTVGARRVVLDSLSGLRLALEANSQTGFRECLFRLITQLSDRGVTLMLTADASAESEALAFLADDLIVLHASEQHPQRRRMLGIAKMRGSEHSANLRGYTIASGGLRLEAEPAVQGSATEIAARGLMLS
jgi:circadian clock protein KaiC